MKVRTSDIPVWAQRCIDQESKRYASSRRLRECDVQVTDHASIPTNWHDANARSIYLYDGNQSQRIVDTGYESAINDPRGSFFGREGRTFQPGEGILIIDSYPRMATLYVPEFQFKQELPPVLTEHEQKIVCIIRTYIPKARQSYFRKIGGVTTDDFRKLQEKGILTRANALTLVGKNVAEGLDRSNFGLI